MRIYSGDTGGCNNFSSGRLVLSHKVDRELSTVHNTLRSKHISFIRFMVYNLYNPPPWWTDQAWVEF
jgi:hypothetical protein